MTELERLLRAEINQQLAALRVTPLNGESNPVPRDDPAAIVSGVPVLTVERGADAFVGRRCRLKFGDEATGQVFLLARRRPVPEGLSARNDRLAPVAWAVDRFGRRFPACCLDGSTNTLHLLVELERAQLVKWVAAGGPDEASERQGPAGAAALVAQWLVADPLRTLLDQSMPLSVGAGVATRVQRLMGCRPRAQRRHLTGELRMLQALVDDHPVTSRLRARIETLRERIAEAEEPAAAAPAARHTVTREVERLKQLVASRACAYLRFSDSDVSGLLNPRPLYDRWRLPPMMFRMVLDTRLRLFLWNPHRREPVQKVARCMEQGEWVVRRIWDSADVYGLVDAVLNFVETNMVGVATDHGPARRRNLFQRLRGWV